MLDVKLNKSLIDNIMILGLRHAVEPLDPENQPVRWELREGPQELGHGLLRHGGCPERGLMLLGAVVPVLMFIAPAVASLLIATVCVECGRTMALTAYGAVSLLSLLFVPDKEVALVFVFLLGYYPLVKPRFERIRLPLVRVLCKLLLCNGAVLAMYGWCCCWCLRAAFRRS